jgi:spore maturation protein CgeB
VLHDFSFAGHIPKPWNEEELNREISVNGGPILRFGDIFDAVLRETAGDFASITPQKAVWRTKRLIRRGCRSRVPSGTKSERKIYDALGWLPSVLTYDVGTRLARLWGRRQLIERTINITESIGIYGPDNWVQWEQYRKYYRGMIENPEDLSRVYRGSRINLHQGVGMHFRVLDCMAAGGVVFAMAREWENLPGEIGDYFEDGSEFVSFTINDFAEKASEILGDHKRRQKMQRAAAKAIAASHTWRHRAEKIMRDYRSL